MNVLTVSHYFESNGAGVEIIASKIRRQLQAHGMTVRWLAARSKNKVTFSEPSDSGCVGVRMWDGIRVATDLAWPIPSPFAIGVFWREVRRADVVHLHEPFYPACQIAFWLARVLKKPIVITQHIADMPVAGRLRKQAVALANAVFTRPAHRSAAKVIFYSTRSMAFFTPSAGCKSLLIHNGCDTSVFSCANQTEVTPLRQRLGLALDKPVVLFVGRFIEKKGLRILRDVASKIAHAQFIFIGLGPLDPKTWGLPNVSVISPCGHEILSEYYRASDVLVLPAVGEGFPLVVQEAMCSGLPCLVSNDVAEACPALADEFLLSGPGGLNTEAVLREYLSQPNDWNRRSQTACHASELWSWDRCGAEYLNVFRSVYNNENRIH